MKIAGDAETISSRERFLEAIVQSAIDYAIISMDLDGLVTSWNEGAVKILGWEAEDMIGKPATVFFTQEDRENGVPQKEMTAALNRGRGNDERWHLRADGTMFWASGEMMALRAPDDKTIGFIKILRDRTGERERAERERLLMHELAHRMKNTLSVVQAIVTQSLRNAVSLDDATDKLQLRIAAYAKAHEILLQRDWVSATLADVVAVFTIVVALLPIAGRDSVRFAQAVFHIGTAHAAANFLTDDRLAPLAAAQQVAATIVLLADYHHFAGVGGRRCLSSVRGGQRDGLAAAWRMVARVLQMLLLVAGAAVSGEGDMAVSAHAAEHAGSRAVFNRGEKRSGE